MVGDLTTQTPYHQLGDRFRSVALAVMDRVAARPNGVPILGSRARLLYGTAGPRGHQRWLWDASIAGLQEREAVVTDGAYTVGRKAKMYRLTQTWAARPRQRAEVEAPRRGGTAASLQEPPASVVPTSLDATTAALDGVKACPRQVPDWIAKHVGSATFDLTAATRHVLLDAELCQHDIDRIVPVSAALGASDFNRIADAVAELRGGPAARAATEHLVPVWRWRIDGVGWCARDPSGWRLHTPISNLPALLRPYLGFGGGSAGPLVEIDATNSQAVFLSHLADRELNTAESHEFAAICAEGRFYEETFRAVYGRDLTPGLERDMWKEQVMKCWLFATYGCQIESMEGVAIGKRWPQIHEWIAKRKWSHGTAYLPCEMQRLEANLWIDSLVPMLELRQIPAFTIHDCVMVAPADEAEVLGMIRALYNAAGMKADFNVKRLTRAED